MVLRKWIFRSVGSRNESGKWRFFALRKGSFSSKSSRKSGQASGGERGETRGLGDGGDCGERQVIGDGERIEGGDVGLREGCICAAVALAEVGG